jgi:hypothetical protein
MARTGAVVQSNAEEFRILSACTLILTNVASRPRPLKPRGRGATDLSPDHRTYVLWRHIVTHLCHMFYCSDPVFPPVLQNVAITNCLKFTSLLKCVHCSYGNCWEVNFGGFVTRKNIKRDAIEFCECVSLVLYITGPGVLPAMSAGVRATRYCRHLRAKVTNGGGVGVSSWCHDALRAVSACVAAPGPWLYVNHSVEL